MTFSQSDFVYSFSPTNWISISDCSMSHPVDIENVVASLRVIRKDILHSSTSNSNLSQSSMEWIRRYDPNTDQYSYFHSTTNSLYSSNPWLSSSSSSSSSSSNGFKSMMNEKGRSCYSNHLLVESNGFFLPREWLRIHMSKMCL